MNGKSDATYSSYDLIMGKILKNNFGIGNKGPFKIYVDEVYWKCQQKVDFISLKWGEIVNLGPKGWMGSKKVKT